uniref:Uncharacterized protein n=1 Tax=Geoglobus ahangari TaxID=113653 RepID=A0A7C3YEN7_9EURY
MGVHRITSEAAKYYAARERVLGTCISLLGSASEKVNRLDKEVLVKLGDLAAYLLPHSPGYAGKLIPVIARLLWAMAGVREREFEYKDLEEIEKIAEDLKKIIEG